MRGICKACGKFGNLVSCEICGAWVCTNCKLEGSCKLCKGRILI